MSLSSVRLRLALGAIAAIAVALAASWFGLVAMFERHVERRIGTELNLHLAQIAAHASVAADGALALETDPSDPRFGTPHSGLYWQIEDERTGALLRSRSLWDLRLQMPEDEPKVAALDVHDIPGPRGETLRAHERRLVFPSASDERVLRLAVAIDRAEIAALTADFAGDARWALLGLSAVLILASLVQIALGTAPLTGIGRQVAAVRSGSARRLTEPAADEVRPLVQEVNALLDTVDRQVARARERAADLAHALKTPLSALQSDAERLAAKGEGEIAADVTGAVATMTAQVERELARIRVRHAVRTQCTPFRRAAEAVVRVIARTPAAHNVTVEIVGPDDAVVPIDATDLNEILGNLIENAVRHAQSRVVTGVETEGAERLRVFVDDDGPGLDAQARERVSRRGERLDTNAGSAGLGLSIVGDILDAYAISLDLDVTKTGGLRASFAFARPRIEI